MLLDGAEDPVPQTVVGPRRGDDGDGALGPHWNELSAVRCGGLIEEAGGALAVATSASAASAVLSACVTPTAMGGCSLRAREKAHA